MPLLGPPDVEKLKAEGDIAGLIKAVCYEKSCEGDSSVSTAAMLEPAWARFSSTARGWTARITPRAFA